MLSIDYSFEEIEINNIILFQQIQICTNMIKCSVEIKFTTKAMEEVVSQDI